MSYLKYVEVLLFLNNSFRPNNHWRDMTADKETPMTSSPPSPAHCLVRLSLSLPPNIPPPFTPKIQKMQFSTSTLILFAATLALAAENKRYIITYPEGTDADVVAKAMQDARRAVCSLPLPPSVRRLLPACLLAC